MSNVTSNISGCRSSPVPVGKQRVLIKMRSCPTMPAEKACSRARPDGRSVGSNETTKRSHEDLPAREELAETDKKSSVRSRSGGSSELKPGLY